MITTHIALQRQEPVGALEVLAFTIGSEEYGVDIQQVQELRGYDAVTRIAAAPDYLKGVLNLRGVIVPIVDMRIKFGIPAPSYDHSTVVVVLNIGSAVVGMVVDSVSDVTTLTPEQIRPVPCLGAGGARHLLGVGLVGERLLMLVDIEKMTSLNDLPSLPDLASLHARAA